MSSAPIQYADRIAATGNVQKGGANLVDRTRVRQIIVCPTTAVGSFVLRQSSGAGAVRLPQVDTPAADGATFPIDIPDGLVFEDGGIHATILNCALVIGYG